MAVLGCGAPDAADDDWVPGLVGEPDACTPDPDAYASRVQPLLAGRCGRCHDEPRYGAPFGLLTYGEVVAGAPGERPSDRMLPALAEGRMPPASADPLTRDEFDTLVEWASCGTARLRAPEPAEASRPVFAATGPAPADAERVELRADGFSLDEHVDFYAHFPFAAVVDRDRFVRRFEVVIDDPRVVHHVVLRRTTPGREAHLYVWTPGTAPIQFPDGGLRMSAPDELTLEIHYANYRGLTGIRDTSGVALWLGPVAGTEYAMLGPTSEDIFVEPRATASAVSTCTADSEFTILAGMPHMHEIGDSFTSELRSPDGTRHEVLSLRHWSFDRQSFYALDTHVNTGDVLLQTCNYLNPRDRRVVHGPATTDEMCIHFIYVTPPHPLLRCDWPRDDPAGL